MTPIIGIEKNATCEIGDVDCNGYDTSDQVTECLIGNYPLDATISGYTNDQDTASECLLFRPPFPVGQLIGGLLGLVLFIGGLVGLGKAM